MKRQPIGQPPLRIPISKPSQTIKLAARLGALDMRLYGVSPSIAATMDKAVKVCGCGCVVFCIFSCRIFHLSFFVVVHGYVP